MVFRYSIYKILRAKEKTVKRFIVFFIAATQFGCPGFSNENNTNIQQTDLQGGSMRFQDPLFPFPYNEEEVVFHNTPVNVTLSGTLTLPDSAGPFPAVILLHGSAPLDRDSSMFGHKLFLVWADHLTKQGIAVLRFDKRSAGKSTGNYNNSTLEDFADDALAAIEYLKNRKEINVQQIGLVGHSEGGMTALLASSKSSDIAFVLLMASPCVNWEELILTQEAALQRIDGISEEIIAKNLNLRKQVFTILKEEGNREIAEKKLRELLTKQLSKLTDSERQVAENYYGPLESQIQFFNSAWFRYNFTYDPANTLKQIKIPLLALNGELDFIVSSKQNLTRIKQALEEAGHKDHTVKELAKLNHAFQTCQTGSVTECANIEETTAPVALNMMSEWILEKTRPFSES